MRLTNYSDYALRTLMYLAVMPDATKLATISEIADSYQISKSHLTKVIHQLAQLGFIESVRGKNGGIRLGRPAEQINLGDVVRQTEPDFDVVPCFEVMNKTADAGQKERIGAPCAIQPACRLKLIFREATIAFIAVMDGYTLADIVQNKQTLWELLK